MLWFAYAFISSVLVLTEVPIASVLGQLVPAIANKSISGILRV